MLPFFASTSDAMTTDDRIQRLKKQLLLFRKELIGMLRLAGPIIIAQLAYPLMGFADAAMSGRVSARDLAAIALGGSIWFPALIFMNGILLVTTPNVAQRFAAGKEQEIGPLVRQALWIALIIGLSMATLLWNAEFIFRLLHVNEDVMPIASGYLKGVACGFPAAALYQVLRCCSDGLGRTKPAMLIGIFALIINIPSNYIFIYGKFGLPAMGGVGCGWATTIVMWSSLLLMLAWVNWAPYYKPSQLFEQFNWPRWLTVKRLLAVGVPIGIAGFAESSIFSVIALLIGDLDEKIISSHQTTLNFSGLVFMIPYSLGMAATVRVGQALGRKQPQEARYAAIVSMVVAVSYSIISAGMILLFRDQIPMLYTRDAQVITLAASLLVFAALFQFSDAIQVIAAGALRGYQDTRATMILTLISYWGIGLPIGYALGISDWFGPARGPAGLWQGLVVGLSCAALMLGIRLHKSSRRHIRLQEQR